MSGIQSFARDIPDNESITDNNDNNSNDEDVQNMLGLQERAQKYSSSEDDSDDNNYVYTNDTLMTGIDIQAQNDTTLRSNYDEYYYDDDIAVNLIYSACTDD